MLMEKAREELVKYGKKLVTAGLTKGTGGNLSVFDRENRWWLLHLQELTSLKFSLRIS